MKNVEGAGTKLGATFVDVGAASDRTAPKVHNLRSALSSFDGVLASMGVNIGTEIRGLTDLEAASGKTFSQLGLLATAGLAAGAALAGWKIGRLIADFFDLDKAIGSATAKMLGWGDLIGQEAGAKHDAMNRAFELTGVVARDAAHALELTTRWQKEQTEGLKLHAKELADDVVFLKALAAEQERWGLIMAELNSVGGNWFKTLQGIDGEVVAAVKYYLEAGVSQGTLASAYALTAVQVKAVATAMSEELAMAKVLNDFITSASANQAALDARAMASIEAKTQKLREATAQAIAFNEAFLQNALSTALAADKAMFGEGVDTSQLHSGQRGPAINAGPGPTGTTFNAGFKTSNLKLPGFASGGPVLQDGPIYAHAGEFVTPKGGGGPTVNNTFYVNGTAEDVARQIADTVLRTVMRSTKLGLA